MRKAAIAIGSNLGDRHAAIGFAARHLSSLLVDFTLSGIIETRPAGEGTGDQPLYLNAVATGGTGLTARELLDVLFAIEQAFGRSRPHRNAARTLDLDLILLGEQVVVDDGLEVPHPRFRERFFVLGPLAEIDPGMIDPVSGERVSELLRRLKKKRRA